MSRPLRLRIFLSIILLTIVVILIVLYQISLSGTQLAFFAGGDIYLLDVDYSWVDNLTANSPYGGAPVWSADGGTIAFDSAAGTSRDVYLLTVGTRQIINYTASPDRTDGMPVWALDGSFSYVRYEGDAALREVYEIALDENGIDRPFAPLIDVRVLTSMAWSPDGTRIAYTSNSPLANALYVVDANGQNRRVLTEEALHFVWSPDSTEILFETPYEYRSRCRWLCFINLETLEIRAAGVTGSFPAWSPDGTQIAYFNVGTVEILDLASGDITRLAIEGTTGGKIAWSPDNRWLAFLITVDMLPELYIADIETLTVRPVTQYGDFGTVVSFAWRP